MARPWVFRDWQPEDIELAYRIKEADAVEVAASDGFTPMQAISFAVDHSLRAEAILVDGNVEAVWGLAEFAPAVGVPWLLSSPVLVGDARQLVREGRRIIAESLERYPLLFNWVDVRNAHSRGWLASLGFIETEIDPAYGVAGVPFVRMEVSRV